MSRPRKPFGATHPGRLPATMMKVLATEMSDPQRLRRGKQYARDGSVLDIVIEPGVVTVEVQGSRPTPYIASLEVTAGDGMPLRRDVTTTCTCPDADNWDDHACKHALAAMFTFSDELLLEPELLDVWRGRSESVPAGTSDAPDRAEPSAATAGASRRHLRLVSDRSDEPVEADPVTADPLDELTSRPAGVELPEIPHLEQADPPRPRSPRLAAVLDDALAHVRVDWD